LRWREVDLESQTITLGDSKTGRSRRPIGKAAIEVIERVDRTADEWLFPASRGEGSASHKKALRSLFSRAGLDTSPKVLRSTFASVAADLGYADGTIADILGHARRGVTERHYIRRVDSVLIAAADTVAAEIDRLMSAE
jgi:integrase